LNTLAGLLISSLGRGFGRASHDTRIELQERFDIPGKGKNEVLSYTWHRRILLKINVLCEAQGRGRQRRDRS
jgi:hypothetical protein